MAKIFNYKGKCWWCGDKADSSEHKHKKSDLIQEFGHGAYKEASAVVKNIQGKQINIQGSKSQEVKFDKNICQKCNNQKSQSFDRSYEKFTKYIRKNEETIIKSKCLIFSDIYGESWKKNWLDLLRYYVKHICCRLASSNISISSDIIKFLDGSENIKHLSFYLEIREDIVAMIQKLKKENIDDGCLWIGAMYALKNEEKGEINKIESFLGYRWLRLNYSYNTLAKYSSNNFRENKVILPCEYNIDPKNEIEFKS